MVRSSTDDPFAVHRAARRRATAVGTAIVLGVGSLVAVAWAVPSVAAPIADVVVEAAPAAPPVPVAPAAPVEPAVEAAAPTPPAPIDAAAPATIPQGAADASPPAVAPAPVQAGPASYDLHVDVSGYQVELDRCLWVRMDVGAVSPIVGAHNNCGGDVILAMNPGDVVTLTGEGVDGTYVVGTSRDAHKGDDAATATAGMPATVILQTCYWEGTGVRLVPLLPV
jgi:hypothetical protein